MVSFHYHAPLETRRPQQLLYFCCNMCSTQLIATISNCWSIPMSPDIMIFYHKIESVFTHKQNHQR